MKKFFSETRRELPFGFEPKTCWFVINCSIHLSYDSITAVWRIRTSKSFPTECLANISNTIMGIRHAMAQFLDTQLTNSTLRLPEGVVPSKWSWWSEIRTLQTYRNRFTVGLLFQLHIHQCQKCVFTELSLLIKQVPWFFMCIPTTVLTFGYSLSLPVLRKDTGLIFTSRNRKDSNPRFCRDQCSTSWTTIPLTAIWRLATIFIVPCVALDFIVFTD